jgi:flavorubredoxin
MSQAEQPFLAEKISENVYWVGAIDWDLEEFHGYLTQRGTTYNAYLVLADKVTLVDTVKAPCLDEMMARIRSVIDPKKIDVFVSNHAEMDHSGCIPQVLAEIEPQAAYASTKGVEALDEHFELGGSFAAVESGQSISLGNMNLTFVETRMIHWPDSMVGYLDADGILFSQDAFGMHLATSRIFADQNDRDIMLWEAEKYYANIVLPYSKQVARVLESLPELNLDIRIVAPDHGPVWRTAEDIEWILAQYRRFVAQEPAPRAVVVFDTMWRSTEKLAKAVGEGLRLGGVEAKVFCMGSAHRSDVATEVMNSGALIVGSPTLNSGIFPTVADLLTYIRGLKPLNKIGAVFGSYGWNRKAIDELHRYVDEMGIELVADDVTVKYVPREAALMAARRMGQTVAQELRKRC